MNNIIVGIVIWGIRLIASVAVIAVVACLFVLATDDQHV